MNDTARRVLAKVDAEQPRYYHGPLRVTVSPEMLRQITADDDYRAWTEEDIRWAAERQSAVDRTIEAGIAGENTTLYGVPLWIDATLADDEVRVLWDETTVKMDSSGNPLPPPLAYKESHV